MRPGRALLGLLVLTAPSPAPAQTVSRTVGQLTMVADLSHAFPGGIVVARLHSRRRLGTTYALFGGRRSMFHDTSQGPRAFVPLPVTSKSGPEILGIEVFARGGRQRMPLDITIAPRDYPLRSMTIPETRRHLMTNPAATRSSRQLLALLRTQSPTASWQGPFRAPVYAAPVTSFGCAQTSLDGPSVEYLTDGLFGDYHRGLDYEVPLGTVVQAPAAATVLFAGLMSVPGNVVVLNHGHGVVSVLAHLSRVDVREGDVVEARAPVGLSGESGVVAGPLLQWRLYVNAIAVDPRVMEGVGAE